ncbi:MAG: ABC transporter ATP-binding protein [Marinilabiliales bacterium]|nr:MAG: ABC transporter ATP-binding protein [Marinilabiliales bacterium]
MSVNLQIKDLEIGYNHALTNNINLSVKKGEIICIIGRNGTGKSTLLNTLSGVNPQLNGNIIIDNIDLSKLKAENRATKISYVPSKQEYLSNLKVIDLVSMGRSPYTNIFDKKSGEDNTKINKALLDFELKNLKHKNLCSISDGERQKAIICRAFVQETPIILLDEPTAFLDYYSKHKLLNLLNSLAKEQNRSIVFSTHDLEIAFQYVNKVWLFEENQVNQYNIEELKQTDILEKVLCYKF